MGLASALNTALTGLTAAETTIDVVGNNLANSNTVGFKESKAVFATQFLQTQSLGSGPTPTNGGTDPRQIGLGTQVAEITPNFTQGTIQASTNPLDLAIQGDGFFIVQGATGEDLYTRNGIFKTNSENQIVTTTGNRLQGFGVDSNFQLVTTKLDTLTIPLGTTSVAQATQNVVFQGTLTPTAKLADTAQIIQSAVLGDGQYDAPPSGTTNDIALGPVLGSMAGAAGAAGPLGPGSYSYKIVFADASGNETDASTLNVTLASGSKNIDLTGIPSDSTGKYTSVHIYRSVELGSLGSTAPTYYHVTDVPNGTTTATDSTSDATLVTNPQLDTSTLTGNYSYYVTFTKPGFPESRPSPIIGPRNIVGDRIVLSDFPAPTGDYVGGQINIYRNSAADATTYHLVDTVNSGESYVDYKSDASISGQPTLDLDGPKIINSTKLVDVVRRDGADYEHEFDIGTLSFTGTKGGRALGTKTLEISSSTTVQDLIDFVDQATGIRPGSSGPNGIPIDSSGASPGGSILNGVIKFVSNNGEDNAVSIGNNAFQLTTSSGLEVPNLGFSTAQDAVGQGAVADFIVYDSLGIPLNVRVTADLESRTSTESVYRWFADSSDNDPSTGAQIGVGTGLIKFDREGNVLDVTNDTVDIQRRHIASIDPLEFKLDFSQLSGLAASTSTLAAARQDGSAAGTLSSYNIGEDGLISGVFTNGITRTLGQLQLAKFANPTGLEQKGENLFAAGPNSGLPVQGNPGQEGIGSIVAGATELSNSDIGKNLIDLILASTQYRGNTRVVTTAQQLLDELLSLRQ